MSVAETDLIGLDPTHLGMAMESLQDWLRLHPDSTEEQRAASARRYAIFVTSKLSFFKRVRLGSQLLKRTDLQTSLDLAA
jgi:hypothetical protein